MTTSTDSLHGYTHHGPSYRNYVAVFVGLAVLTTITVAMSYSGLSHEVRTFLALIIAGIKACLVALIFMHLKFEKRILAIFAIAPVILAIFFIIAIAPDIGNLKLK